MTRRRIVPALGLLLWLSGSVRPAEAQLSKFVTPGPLANAHAALEGVDKCQKCHEPGRRVTAERCLACHKPIADRIAAKKGAHRKVSGDCVPCHIEHGGVDADLRRFDPRKFNHAAEAGLALDGRHAPLASKCASCHKTRSFLTARARCDACHADIHKGALTAPCEACHSTGVAFREALTRFDHSKAVYPLDGAHRSVACAKCHVNKVYRGLRFASCSDCHREPHRQMFPGACTSCHTGESWKTQKVDHAKAGYPLRGKHAEAACVSCHTRPPLQAKLKADRCTACHTDVHKGEFKQDCNACHTENGFRRVEFDHQAKTKYALTGKHAGPACSACHKGVKAGGALPGRAGRALPVKSGATPTVENVDFRGLSTACASCHADVHRTELGPTCETCHTTATFRVTTFTHPRLPTFYGGQHSGVPCARCHAPQIPRTPPRPDVPLDGWRFKNLPTACASCHRDVHLGQVGSACETCHPIGGNKFSLVSFSHARTTYPLTGKHQDVVCGKCHKSETGTFPSGRGTAVRLKGLSTTCQGCHEDRHFGQLGNRCDSCHTPAAAAFKIAAYTHVGKAGFFVGKHASPKCEACHKRQEAVFPSGRGTAVRYKGFGTTCTSCHTDQHKGTLGTDCSTCHESGAWVVISRAFHKVGVFPLEGRHLTTDCGSCHQNGVTKGTPARCYDCHWIRRQDDPYRTGLGNQCDACHRPISWTAIRWNHAATGIGLNAEHRTLACGACHTSRRFQPGEVQCASCHIGDYQRTTSPNHQAAGFPTACNACHLPSAPSFGGTGSFLHASFFPLVGMHATQPCASCHRNGIYKGTPRDCYGCHRARYEQTRSPNHIAAGFPTSCEACHRSTDTAFTQGRFDHTWFPITSGRHAGNACSACHAAPSNFKVFSCLTCHDRARTDSKHAGRAGYRYDSQACYTCHPQGRG